VRSIRVFAKKTWAIPIMNPLSWFMIVKALPEGFMESGTTCLEFLGIPHRVWNLESLSLINRFRIFLYAFNSAHLAC